MEGSRNIKSIWSNTSFRASVSLLILCLYDLFIAVRTVLKSPSISVLVSISPFKVISGYLIYWGDPTLGAYIFTVVRSSQIDPLIVMYGHSLSLIIFFKVYFAEKSIAISAVFWFPFAWNIFFHPLTFSVYVSLELKWVSCRQHIQICVCVCVCVCVSCFCIHSASLCLLVGSSSLLTFKAIIDMYVFIALSLIVLDVFCLLFFFCSLVVWWLSLVLCLSCFFLFVCYLP